MPCGQIFSTGERKGKQKKYDVPFVRRAEESAQDGWYRSAPDCRTLAEPAQRHIAAIEEPRGPGRPRRED